MKKPLEIKKKQGTLHTTREKGLGISPVNLVSTKPDYPKRLKEYGRIEWDRVWEFLAAHDMVDNADISALESYCYERQRYFLYCEMVEREGETQTSNTGLLSAHPMIAAADRALKTAEQISKMFGFSPSARSSLAIVKPKKQESKMAILKGRIDAKKVM